MYQVFLFQLIGHDWCYRKFGLWDLILTNTSVNRWYVYRNSAWLSLVLRCRNFRLVFEVALAHRCYRCLVLIDPPNCSVWVLPLNSCWRGACLSDFVVFLHDRSLGWALLSTVTTPIWLRLLVVRRAASDLRSRFPLFNTSLLFFKSVIVLRLVEVLEMRIGGKEVQPAVSQTYHLFGCEQVMVNQVLSVLRLYELTLPPARTGISITNAWTLGLPFSKVCLWSHLFPCYVDNFT